MLLAVTSAMTMSVEEAAAAAVLFLLLLLLLLLPTIGDVETVR
jgi:hypothetical protein